jgi:ABC-type transport system involved in multi-copper enzyme maturation permease subunit
MIALAFVLTLFAISLIGAMGALFAPPTRRQRIRGAAFGAVGTCFGCAFVVGRLWQEQSIALALPIGIAAAAYLVAAVITIRQTPVSQ